MSSDEGRDIDGGEGGDIKSGKDRRLDKAKPAEKSAFLAMVLSGVLSLTIATIMFMIGVFWGYREDARELRGLVQFFAVEVVEIYAETAETAEMRLVYSEPMEESAPRMVSAVTISRANALRVDPSLMSTLRSIYGRHARVLRDLKSFKKGGAWHQMTAVINDCRAMGKEVRHVLEVAADEGVDGDALKPLETMVTEAGSRIDTIVQMKADLFPAVAVTRRISSIPVRIDETIRKSFLVKNWSPEKPFTVTKASTSMEFVRLVLPEKMTVDPLGELKIEYEITPRELEVGPFEGTITLETDAQGFEKITIDVQGKVYPPRRRK